MKKRLLLLCTAIAVLMLWTAPVAAGTYGDLTYSINLTDGVVAITGCAEGASGALEIPSTIEGYPVTSIEESAFEYCFGLTSVKIPSGVTTIKSGAFLDCSGLTSITIPDTVTSIGNAAFCACRKLATITIPWSVTSIGDSAFEACNGLTAITVQGGNRNYSSDNYGVLYDKDKSELIKYPVGNNRTSYIMPNSVTSIRHDAFMYCSDLTSVTIGNSVTSIEDYAFAYCGSLTAITIPDSVTSIGDYAFKYCDSSTSVMIGSGLTSISEGVFAYCAGLTSVTIGSSVTSIGKEAFRSCTGLTSVTIPNSVTAIDYCAFSLCAGLTSVIVENPRVSFDYSIFSWCDSLTLYGHSGSTTEEYAKANAIPFKTLANRFNDVPTDQYYYEPVCWAVENGITSGTSATTFSPENPCTRGQVVVFLWRAMGEQKPTSMVSPFSDVQDSGKYYYKAVLWAVENGITSGTSATTFSPEDTVTRSQFVSFLWRAKGKPVVSTVNPFSDVAEGAYYYDAVMWAYTNKVTAGTSTTTFSPENPCSRGQVVSFLYRDMK